MLPTPSVRLVLALALPVLAQQGLHLIVSLSDSMIAGKLQDATPEQRLATMSLRCDAILSAGQQAPGTTALPSVARATASLAVAGSRRAAVQAAQTTAHYLAWAITSYTVFVTVGSTALVARFVGARDMALARAVLHQSLILAAIFGGFLTIAGLAGGIEAVVGVLNLQGDAARFASQYLAVMFVLLLFQVIEAAGIACLVGAGDTRTGLFVMIGVALVNLPLTWGFAFGVWPLPALGFVGIALGTGLSHSLGCLAVMTVLVKGRYGLKIDWRQLRPRFDLIARLLRVSVPAAADSLSTVVGQFWFLSIVNQLGEVASGAHGIALRWEALGYLSGAAFGTAAMTLVGQNLGAGRPDLARRSGYLAFALGGGLMSGMGILFFALAPFMFHALTLDANIVAAGVPVLRLVAFAMPALAPVIIFTAALRGAGDTRVPVLFTWIGFFAVRIPLAYLLTKSSVPLGPFGVIPGAGLGLFGAWLAMFADLFIRGAFFLARFVRGRWQSQKV
jgi:putative MATE family efflux protein